MFCFVFLFKELWDSEYKTEYSHQSKPGHISILQIVTGVFEIREYCLQRTGRQFGVQPLVVEEDVLEQIVESSGSHQVIGQLSKLEVQHDHSYDQTFVEHRVMLFTPF